MTDEIALYKEAAGRLERLVHRNLDAEMMTMRNLMCLIDPRYSYGGITPEAVDVEYETVASSNEEWYTSKSTAYEIAADLTVILHYPYGGREYITELALRQSLCPYHFVDYAICFEDDSPECAMIRLIHPSHDT